MQALSANNGGNAPCSGLAPKSHNRDDFPSAVKQLVFKRAAGICSNPDCNHATVGPHTLDTKFVNIGVVAHICAASPGGPRYDRTMDVVRRKSIKNAVYLCQDCAKLIDSDEIKYNPQLLVQWKKMHEDRIASSVGKPMPISSYPTDSASIYSDPRLEMAKHEFHRKNRDSAYNLYFTVLGDAIDAKANHHFLSRIHAFLELCQPIDQTSITHKSQTPLLLKSYKPLALLATAVLPPTEEYLSKLFPKIAWKREIAILKRYGCLTNDKDYIILRKSARMSILTDKDEARNIHEQWVRALEPIKEHVDTALWLSLHYIALKRYEEALCLVSDIACSIDTDIWNKMYLDLLLQIHKTDLMRRVCADTRLRCFNSIGICYTSLGKYRDGILTFLKLRRLSAKYHNVWALGQSHINIGVAYYRSGEIKKAISAYKEAVIHARKTNDKWLLAGC